jgi:hypothetical protein
LTNPTSNYGFVLPTSTDLVTDLPADFEVALQGVDTRLKALQPGTTLGDIAYSSATANTNTRLPIGTSGQVLAVSGGVPAWTTTADVTPLTTKGDLFTFDTADARLGVGTNGQTLVADSTASTGLKWATPSSGALTKIVSGSFTASAGLSVNSCFTSTYKNYKVMFRIKASTTAGTIAWRWRTSGTDLSTGSYYYGWNLTNNNATTTLSGANAATSIDLGGITETSYFNNYSYDVFGPQANTQIPSFYGGGTFTNAGQRGFGGGISITVGAYDGFSLITAQNITGEYVVYGYEN